MQEERTSKNTQCSGNRETRPKEEKRKKIMHERNQSGERQGGGAVNFAQLQNEEDGTEHWSRKTVLSAN